MTIPDDVPQADNVQVWFCNNPECLRPHIFLFDGKGKAFAQFVMPDARGPGSFFDDLKLAIARTDLNRRIAMLIQ